VSREPKKPKGHGVHSADVRLTFIAKGGNRYDLARISKNRATFRNFVTLNPCDGEIVMTIDGEEERWNVRLPDGVTAGERFSRIEDIGAGATRISR
jgi:hypothetical protein